MLHAPRASSSSARNYRLFVDDAVRVSQVGITGTAHARGARAPGTLTLGATAEPIQYDALHAVARRAATAAAIARPGVYHER